MGFPKITYNHKNCCLYFKQSKVVGLNTDCLFVFPFVYALSIQLLKAASNTGSGAFRRHLQNMLNRLAGAVTDS